MPTATQLTGMRARYAARLPRTSSVPGARTVVNAGDGTWSETTASAATGIKCSFRPASGTERVVGGGVAEIGQYVLRFEHGVTLDARMTIEFDASADAPAKTFQLIAPLDRALQIGQEWLATEG